jgi:hypothetical protein
VKEVKASIRIGRQGLRYGLFVVGGRRQFR